MPAEHYTNDMIDRLFSIPEGFFEARRDRMHGFRGTGIALVVATLLTALTAGVMRMFARQMTATTEIDNPDRPPEIICDMASSGQPSGCDEPATISVEVGDLFWDAVVEQLPTVFAGVVIFWFLTGVGLHLVAGGYVGEGSFGQTLSVVAWSMLINVLSVAISGLLLWLATQQIDLAVSSPEQLLSQMRRLTTTVLGFGAQLVQVIALVAQVGVWTAGLTVVHRNERAVAAVGSVIVGAVWLVLIVL